MIITRIADTVEFQLSENRRISIDISCIVSAALTFERHGDGSLAPALILSRGAHAVAERIEAAGEKLAVMHARIIELMGEIAGPAASAPSLPMLTEDDGFMA